MFQRRDIAQSRRLGGFDRLTGIALAVLAFALVVLASGAEAWACPSKHQVSAEAAAIDVHDAKLVAMGARSVASGLVRAAVLPTTHAVSNSCEGSSQSDDGLDCPGQCCVACSAAIDAASVSLPPLVEAMKGISFIANWSFSLRLLPLLRPPRALA